MPSLAGRSRHVPVGQIDCGGFYANMVRRHDAAIGNDNTYYGLGFPVRMEKITNRILRQESKAKGEERTFEIYNDKYLKVVTHSLLGDVKFHINLSMMEPWPVRHRKVSWRWLLALVYFGFSALAYIAYMYYRAEAEVVGRVLPFAVVFVLLALGSLLMFLYRSPNVTEFRSRYGGVCVFSLLYNKPDPDEFKSFVEEIKHRILGASQQVKIDKRQMVAIELKEIRRLQNEGALSAADYEKAKQRILNIQM